MQDPCEVVEILDVSARSLRSSGDFECECKNPGCESCDFYIHPVNTLRICKNMKKNNNMGVVY